LTARSLHLVEGGAANSRPSLTGETTVGVDTVRFRWRDTRDAADSMRRRGFIEGARGEMWDKRPGGGRFGVYRDGTAYVECRATQLVDDEQSHALTAPGRLLLAAQVAATQLLGEGVDVGDGSPRLGRCDLAGELAFSDGREGVAFLYALSQLDVPWAKVGTEGAKRDELETVYYRGTRGRSVTHRIYDKGRESGSDPAGRRIRLERQLRFRKAREQTVEAWSSREGELIAVDFLDRRKLGKFEAIATVAIADVVDAIAVVAERCDGLQRERLTGFLITRGAGLARPTWFRRHAELRALGVAIDVAAVERRDVIVGPRLRELRTAWEGLCAA
jgi:hypothetical protein